ncbi:hypothetical protein FACS189499_03680 [Clostridia bacterium]|nr:hypothetical protein FACS189499_03680 [Clostridia bacterium]
MLIHNAEQWESLTTPGAYHNPEEIRGFYLFGDTIMPIRECPAPYTFRSNPPTGFDCAVCERNLQNWSEETAHELFKGERYAEFKASQQAVLDLQPTKITQEQLDEAFARCVTRHTCDFGDWEFEDHLEYDLGRVSGVKLSRYYDVSGLRVPTLDDYKAHGGKTPPL